MNSAHEFERLYSGARRLHESNFDPAGALATIIRTRGSTFRRAGTSMLVHADGSVVCALSGGCPQRDIVTRAQAVIESGKPAIAKYDRDSGLDVLMEMGCGGELEVLIEPVANAEDTLFLQAIAKIQSQRATAFVATAFAHEGLVLSPRPQRLVCAGNVEWNGIKDAALAQQIMSAGFDLEASLRTEVQRFRARGGAVDVLFESLRPAHTLIVIGFNSLSLALAEVSARLGWETLLVDHSNPPDEMACLPVNVHLVRATPQTLRQMVRLDHFSSVVVMTFNVERDIAYLGVLADTAVAYLGAIGSHQRAARMREAIASSAAPFHAPAGLDLGSETPEEIALAVAAEILGNLNARSGGKRLLDH